MITADGIHSWAVLVAEQSFYSIAIGRWKLGFVDVNQIKIQGRGQGVSIFSFVATNALISLGSSTYLEIIAPDPEQTEFEGRRIFRIDELGAPTLVTWAANADDINRIAATDIGDGETPGASLAGSRRRPDGVLLAWQYTDPSTVLLDGVVPFFINWGDTPHPAASAPGGARLLSLRVEHPDADGVRRAFAALGLEIPVTSAPSPALIAVIESPNGTVELR